MRRASTQLPATYEAVIRFSNGLGHLGPDAMLGPIFGTGLKFFNVPGHSILENEAGGSNFDYAMINAPVFFANTAKDYVVIERLFDALPGALMDPRTAKTWLHDFVTCDGTLPPDKWLWDELLAVLSLGKTPFRNPLLSSYWTRARCGTASTSPNCASLRSHRPLRRSESATWIP